MKHKATVSALIMVIVIGIIVVLNYIVGYLNFLNPKFDLTEKNIYTLSDGTRRIIERINPDEPVTLRFYATQDARIMPQAALNYVTPVRDLLSEIEKESRGKIKLERIDPRPSTEDEDKAIADDITGFNGLDGGASKFYLGLAVEAVDHKEIIPVLNPNDEAQLEYLIARAISKVTSGESKRLVVGVMSAMPIAAPAMNFPGMPQRTPPPWIFIQHLRQDYDVREVPMTSDSIDADIKILFVVHPAGISDSAQFAIDQFLLKGGKVIAMVDPRSMVAEAVYSGQNQMGMGMPPSSIPPVSDLPKLFKSWGIGYNSSSLVTDMTYRLDLGGGRSVPTFLSVGRSGINTSEPLTSELEKIQMFSAGAFDVSAREGITATRLVESSENSSFIDSSEAEKVQTQDMTTFQPDGKRKVLAVRLTGTFTTAFPEGAPKAEPAPAGGPRSPGIPGLPPGVNIPGLPGETGGEDKKDAGAPAAAATPAPAASTDAAPATPAPAAATPAPAEPAKPAGPETLKKSVNNEGMVFLFSDADMLYDVFALQRDQSGRPLPIPSNSNIPMMLNIIEMASGSSDLVAVRSRASSQREFTKMSELMSTVEAKYRPIIEEQNQALAKVVQEIASLSGAKQEQGVVFLNPNKQQLQKLKDTQLEIQKKKRDAEKELKRQKDTLEMKITVANMIGIPLLVIAIGLVLAMRRHSLQAAH